MAGHRTASSLPVGRSAHSGSSFGGQAGGGLDQPPSGTGEEGGEVKGRGGEGRRGEVKGRGGEGRRGEVKARGGEGRGGEERGGEGRRGMYEGGGLMGVRQEYTHEHTSPYTTYAHVQEQGCSHTLRHSQLQTVSVPHPQRCCSAQRPRPGSTGSWRAA